LCPEPDSEWSQNLRNLSSVIRKIAYIEWFFNEQFLEFSKGVSQESLLAIELIFRAITEGEFAIRSSEITFRRLNASKLTLNEAPFTGPGKFSRSCEENGEHMAQPLLGKELYLGPFSIRVEKSEIANRRVLDNLSGNLEGPIDIKFVVYDHQVSYRFDRYAGDKHREERLAKLAEFKKALAEQEPEDLIGLMCQPLQADVSRYEAIQIAAGWLQYHDFPDRYCAQEPVLDKTSRKWQVPIHLAYADGRGGSVGELVIDLKTGVIERHTPAEVMRAEGLALAEKLLNAR